MWCIGKYFSPLPGRPLSLLLARSPNVVDMMHNDAVDAFREQLANELHCNIYLDTFTNSAATTNCSPVFCEVCLADWVSTMPNPHDDEDGFLRTCPTCRCELYYEDIDGSDVAFRLEYRLLPLLTA